MQVKTIDYNWLVKAWFDSHDVDVSMTREASRFQQIFKTSYRSSNSLTGYAMLVAELRHLPKSRTWSYWELVLKHAFPLEYGEGGLEGIIAWLVPQMGPEDTTHSIMSAFVEVLDKSILALAARVESQLHCAPDEDKPTPEDVKMLTNFLASAGNHIRAASEAAHDNSESST